MVSRGVADALSNFQTGFISLSPITMFCGRTTSVPLGLKSEPACPETVSVSRQEKAGIPSVSLNFRIQLELRSFQVSESYC